METAYLIKKHVPASGAPSTGGKGAELAYALMKVQHEYFNNGFINAIDDFYDVYCAHDLQTENFKWGCANMLGFLMQVSPTAEKIIDYCEQCRTKSEEENEEESEK